MYFLARFLIKLIPKLQNLSLNRIYSPILIKIYPYCFYVIKPNYLLQELHVLQNCALQIILRITRSSNCNEMLDRIKNQRIICLIFKFRNNMFPPYLSQHLLYVLRVHYNMQLWNATEFRLQSITRRSSRQNVYTIRHFLFKKNHRGI